MKSICSVEGCEDPVRCKAHCEKHYQRLRKYGDPLVTARAPNGAGNITEDGYRRIRVNGKLRFEHDLVMERKLGRSLLPGEIVHHKNGGRLDNGEGNLELVSSRGDHNRMHATIPETREKRSASLKRHYAVPENLAKAAARSTKMWETRDREATGNAIREYWRTHPEELAERNRKIRGAKIGGRWHKDYDACVECGLVDRKHEGRGLCAGCYQRVRLSGRLEEYPLPTS